jgi:hypothetical protein
MRQADPAGLSASGATEYFGPLIVHPKDVGLEPSDFKLGHCGIQWNGRRFSRLSHVPSPYGIQHKDGLSAPALGSFCFGRGWVCNSAC